MTNYNNLKIEEKEIIINFKVFLNEIIDFFEKQFNAYLENKNAEEIFDESSELEKRFLRKSNDILDECIWFIQKNEPRANHLRLIIAIINSLNDTKRMSNYIVSFSKFHIKQSLLCNDELIKTKIGSIGRLTIETMHKLYELIDGFNLKTIQAESKIIFNDFLEKYRVEYVDSIDNSVKRQDCDISFIANTIIMIKTFDRFIDHMINIIDNLVTIL